MSISKAQAEKLHRAIRVLVRAEIADSWKGSAYSADVPIIEEEVRAARIRVSVIIAQLLKDVTPDEGDAA